MLNILVVCTGNTCRSPMAEALLQQRIKAANLQDKITVQSAGLAASSLGPASTGAKHALKKHGLDLERHKSRRITGEAVAAANLILTMTARHKTYLLSSFPEASGKVSTLAEYAEANQADVVDPFGGSLADYECCAMMLDKLVAKAWLKICEQAGEVGNFAEK